MWLHFVSVLISTFFFSSRRRHTRCLSDWSSDVCSSDLVSFPTGGIVNCTLAAPEPTVRLSGGLAAVPTVNTTGYTPGAMLAGSWKFTWVTPILQPGMPTNCCVTAAPPTVMLKGRRGVGGCVIAAPDGTLPVVTNGATSPSPEMYATRYWPGWALTIGAPDIASQKYWAAPGADAATVKR